MNAQQLQQIQEFINKQATGSTTTVQSEAEIKEVRKNFKNTQNSLAQYVEDTTATGKETQLIAIFEKFIDIQQKYEEQLNIVKLNNSIFKEESEKTQVENMKIGELKDKYSKICLEIGDAIKQIKSTNKLMSDSEEQSIQQLIDNFENSLKDITSKIDEQDKERDDKEKENIQLREDLKQLLTDYEQKEKGYLSGLEEKDGEFKGKIEEFLNQIKSVESEAQTAIRLRQELNQLTQIETEKKLKIAIYQKRTSDLGDSIDRTNATLLQLKESLIKLYWKQQKLHKQQEQLVSQSDKGEATLLALVQKNQDIENEINQVKAKKEALKQKVLETQAKIKAIK